LAGVPGEDASPLAEFEPESCSRSRLTPELDGAAAIGEMPAGGADDGSGSSVFGVSRASNAVPPGCAGWPDDGAAPEGPADDDAATVATLPEDGSGAAPGFAAPGLAAFAVPPVGGTGVVVLSGGHAIAAAVRSRALLDGRFSGIFSVFFPRLERAFPETSFLASILLPT
jgi:hypothetical protein